MNYYAKHGDYMALCAARGNTIKTEDVTKFCSEAGKIHCNPWHVSNYLSGKRYSTNCVRDEVKAAFSSADICNGDKFTFLVTTGEWSLKGFDAHMSAPDDGGRSGHCIAMCHK